MVLVRDAEFWLDTVPRCPHGRKRAHIPVAQAFRPEVCPCCGVVAVEAKTSPLDGVSYRIPRFTWKLPECRRALPARDISLLMEGNHSGEVFRREIPRLTGNSPWAKLFPESGQEVTETVEAPDLQLALEQSDATGFPGTRITLAVEVRLPPDVHVCAPGTKGHKPVKLLLDPIPQLQLQPVAYPPSKTRYLRAITEQVPVFEGSVHISQVRRATRSRARC